MPRFNRGIISHLRVFHKLFIPPS